MLRCLLACLALLPTSCVPAPAERTFPERFSAETIMGEVQARGRIEIGIPVAAPPLAYARRGSQRPRGLAAEIGRIVARTLHVRARFVWARSERLLTLVDEGRVALAFPAIPVTEGRLRQRPFTNPYVVGHQRLLVRAGSRLVDVDDLTTESVCSFIDPKTGVDLRLVAPDVAVVEARTPGDCVARFAGGAVDAVTAADFYLGYMATRLAPERARIVGDSLTTEGYGAAVVPGAGGFVSFLNSVLNAAEEDGRWAKAYERAVGVRPRALPSLTIQEAAALFPMGRSRLP